MCNAFFTNFYYDTVTKSCKTFIYGGCGGNLNRFETLGNNNQLNLLRTMNKIK